MRISESYMKIADSIPRKKCGYLDGHTCPLKPSRAMEGESCDGCSLFEKIITFKELSIRMEDMQNEYVE